MINSSKKVFLDASIFIAFIDRANQNHNRSIGIFETLAREGYQVYTSSLVLQNTYNRLEKDIGFRVAVEFLQATLESNIQTLHPLVPEYVAAFKFLNLVKQAQFSLSEVINADLMVKNRIGQVLTFDSWHDLMGIKIFNGLS